MPLSPDRRELALRHRSRFLRARVRNLEALTRDGRHHYIQLKSGPDTANRDIAQNISGRSPP